MAWESSLVIGGGVSSTGLVAGGSAVAAAQYGVITLSGADAILNNGVISSAGSVIISSGGSVGGAVVHSGGSIFFSANASASDITVSSGGFMRLSIGTASAFNVIANGGSVSVKGRIVDLQPDAAARIGFEGGAAIGGSKTNFTSTQLTGGTQYYNMHINCTNGVLTGVISKTFGIWSGITAQNLSIVSTGNFIANSGAVISGGTMQNGALQIRSAAICRDFTVSNGTVGVSNGASVYGLTVSGGSLTVVYGAPTYDLQVVGDTARVSLYGGAVIGGAKTTFTATQINTGDSYVNNVACTNGELTGVLNKNLTIRDGIHAEDLSVVALQLTVGSGAVMNGGTVSGATIVASSAGVLNGVRFNNATCTVSSGGLITDANFSGGTFTITSGGAGSGLTIENTTLTLGQWVPTYNLRATGDDTVIKLPGGGKIGGSLTTFTAAQLIKNASYIQGVDCTNGHLTGVVSKILAVYDGIHCEDVSVVFVDGGNPARLVISSGATMERGTVGSAALAIVSSAGYASGVTVLANGACSGVYGGTIADLTATAANTYLELNGGNSAKTSGVLLAGGSTNIAEGHLRYSATTIAGHVTDGVLTNLGGIYRFGIGSGLTVSDVSLGANGILYMSTGAVVSSSTIAGGTLHVSGGVVKDTAITGGKLNLLAGGTVSGFTFDLTGKTGQATALLTGAVNLSGTPDIRVIADTETVGNYVLADGDLGN